MDKNYQDKTESKLTATEDKLWLPPLSPKDQKRLARLQKKPFAERMGFAGKTPWDLIQLLLIPLVLVGVGYWFSFTQTQISFQVSERQHQTDLQIAEDQQRETTLKTYLDNMSDLLLNHNLHKSTSGGEVSQLAREQTLTTLRRLDANRNKIVLQFLQDAQLINTLDATGNSVVPIITLSTANLSGDDLRGVTLSTADLNGADLINANLNGAHLSNAHLNGAYLNNANLSNAYLINADLSDAYLNGANLSNANLSDVDLSDAYLSDADLNNASLSFAYLNGAYLNGANLSGATVAQEELKKAKSLQGATMPDGSKHP